ncbi:TetR family transcriptional regulator [Actinoallomurus spadix]|uniref:TetR family transcriptional regulator n=1 Tax=Actinoallomurus spadix TaxID=79912 RepID=A0ABN0XFE3_9ACTN|nr:TetR family transcriptional regulator [Actinoallomurus spadix]MCO5988859.1 TetR family transcriptional regulator [Actinoallomurus spadix]
MVDGEEAPLGLRERKKRETRTALSWATIRLSVERGWDAVTVEDIAAEANVSVRTFRNYFSSKAEAVVARHLDRMLGAADDLRARPADEPLREAIAQVVAARFAPESAGGGRPPRREWVDGVRLMLTEPDVQGEFLKANMIAQRELAKAIAERTGTDVTRDVYPTLVAAVTGTAATVAIDHWMRTDGSAPVRRLLSEVFDRLWAGLPVP